MTNALGEGNEQKVVSQFAYKYDTHGNIIEITDTKAGVIYKYIYDQYEQLTSETRIIEKKTEGTQKVNGKSKKYTHNERE